LSDTELNSIVEYSVDLNNAEAPPALPAGLYPTEIRKVEVATSSKGMPWYKVSFYIAPESYPADFVDGNPDGMLVQGPYLSAEDTVVARFKVRKFIEAIGGKLSNKVDVNTWIGQTCSIETAVGSYEGVPTTECKKVVAN
jgi:hypothetical protein